MKVRPLRFVIALLVLASPTVRAADILAVTIEEPSIELDGRLEARVELGQAYENPFDPSEISVDAVIATPSGAVHRLPAFWDRETTRSLAGDREVITATGDGFFHVRYAPMEQGRHELTIIATDEKGQDTSASTSFEVGPGAGRGFIRVDKTDPLALAYDDGSPYVPIGSNLCWSVEASAGYDMDAYLSASSDAGGNWARLWMTHFGEGWTIEWGADHPTGYYAGLGRYSLEVASRLDRVFETAEKRGIAIQLVLWQHSQLEAETWSSWADNPYNAANGGPAADSRAFLESPEAVELSRRRIRYLVGRYAGYRSLFAWEVMNEMEGVKAPFEVVSAWCAARAVELHESDPYQHLVTTSFMLRPYLAPLSAYESDAYDITQGHGYGGSFAFAIPKDAAALRAKGKPAIFGEFGLDYMGEVDQDDPRGLHLAEGSWIALASGYWGGAMSWWWDSYLRPNDLWGTQRGIAAFVREVDLRGMHEPLPEGIEAEDGQGNSLDVFGRRGETGALLYVRHPDARWEIAANGDIPAVDGARAMIPCSRESSCLAHVYDTSTGEAVGAGTGVTGGGSGTAWLNLPSFQGSVVVVVRPAAGPISPDDGGCQCGVPRRGASGLAGSAVLLLLGLGWIRRRSYH